MSDIVPVYRERPAAPTGPVVVVVQQPPKSVAAATLLTLFFGPLGAFYAGGLWGTLWLLSSVVLAVFTLGLSILLTWPAVVLCTAIKVSNHNKRVTASTNL
jgi:hypothetical protein